MKRLSIIIAALLCAWNAAAQVAPAKALKHYIDREDNTFAWEVRDSLRTDGAMAYRLRMQSQTWREFAWIHELVVIVPDKLTNDEALIHISGGSANEKTGEPNYHKWDDSLIGFMSGIASRCEAVTAILWQVPRQPLYGGKYEDELVSFTFHNYQMDKDQTWPLLFPMTKSVIRAMDAIEEFSEKKSLAVKPERFVTNGISKRGWTTWLTAASEDKRIVAIAPMVIDILNMPVSVPYQRHMFGNYSIQIQDYVNLGLTEEVVTPAGKELVAMIDPYSYRDKYTMPKMLFFGTNDEYWTVDAVKNYIDGIPGTKYISYTTNAGHGLGDKTAAVNTLEAFFRQTLDGMEYPRFDYTIKEMKGSAELTLKADKAHLENVIVWEALSENKDFRQSEFIPTIKGISHKGKVKVRVEYPAKGYKAFIVMAKYRHPNGGEPYNITTRMFTADADEVFDEIFEPEIKVELPM
jgi:PhoPQ-activated pathogenicity-related protein